MISKECTRCHKVKPLSEFHRNTNARDGTKAWCKKCSSEYGHAYRAANREKLRASARLYRAANRVRLQAYRLANREKIRDEHLRRRYNLTPEEYDEMLKIQGGGCAICGRAPSEEGRQLAVDHNHETGKVRGLLCQGCNNGLGRFQDSPTLLRKAATYVEDTR